MAGRSRAVPLLATVVALAVLLTACAGSTSTVGRTGDTERPNTLPQTGGALAYGVETDPNGLDATRNAWDPVGLLVANSLFDTWAAYDANAVAQPYLAQSFEHDADYTSWTIHLRPGVTFSDGEKLDAAAGVKMFNAIHASAITGLAASNIKDVQAVDDLTIRLTMFKPWASFPTIMTGQGGYVMAPKQLDDPSGFLHPIGTGPFVLKKWDSEKLISVVRNPSYWRKDANGVQLPYLDQVDFHIIPDGPTRAAAVQSGTVDVATATNAMDVKTLENLPADNLSFAHDEGSTDTAFVMLNTSQPPLDDVRVRQAIAYATNVDALADPNGWPKDRLANSVFPKGSKWYADVGFPTYDLAKAKALVAAYEADHGPIKFSLTGAFETGVLQQLSDQWAQAGIQTTVAITEFKKYVLQAVGGNYEAELFHYFGAADPDTNWHFWSSSTARPNGAISLNFTRLKDPQIDDAIDRGRASPDEATRKAAYQQLQQRFADLVPYVWLYHTDWVIATRKSVHDVRNVTLPDGSAAEPYDVGAHRLAETWIAAR
jgi:ABC-type transport system substrate-binding protein